ncbi:hypothetical protein [Chroococcidiopsis sp. SAG 2025]|uniref:hypothetical protein n=1 Tax=Chroococcidiopsis sp. SAG 2025 TaxID=171389 RepID=UPI0029370450|nr:hypothetical protein [Chroococcidiopsis sp. SAG 2025]
MFHSNLLVYVWWTRMRHVLLVYCILAVELIELAVPSRFASQAHSSIGEVTCTS